MDKPLNIFEPAAAPKDTRKAEFMLNRLQKTLRGDVGRAIGDYNMIQD